MPTKGKGKPKLNVRMLRRIQEVMREEPLRVNMDTWLRRPEEGAPACGTVGCIAGWAIVLDRLDKKGLRLGKRKLTKAIAPDCRLGKAATMDYGMLGAKVLGINIEPPQEPGDKPDWQDTAAARELFLVNKWPVDLYDKYNQGTQEARAAATVERIDRYIEEHS